MLKRILFTLLSIFLMYESLNILGKIDQYSSTSMLLDFLVAWILNILITGIFAFLVFAHPIEKLLPDFYYRIKKPKTLKQVFKILGVEHFRKFLLATFWRNKDQRNKYFDGTLAGIDNWETQSKKSDFGHIFPFILITFLSVYLISISPFLALCTMLLNILGNLYPVILQRHHRMRIQVLRKRIDRKTKS